MQPGELDAALAALDARAERRHRVALAGPQGPEIVIDGRRYLNFSSNDYLGLAGHPRLVEAAAAGARAWGVGSGASALVTGHFEVQRQAERALAGFAGCEAALLLESGYAANLAAIPALVGRGDTVFADRLNHASLNDGCLLSRARLCRFRHNDPDHLEYLLKRTPANARLIAVDAVYSMDGDEAPLARLAELAERYDAWLYLDDAHGFGVLGDGRGSMVEQGVGGERILYMATLGKAAGVGGAFLAGNRRLIDWLANRARPYVFSTAQPPLLAAALLASLELIAGEPWRRARLASLAARLAQHCHTRPLALKTSRTAIHPLIIGDNLQTLNMSRRLREAGIWVPAIRPPTVAPGSARLRISLCAAHRDEDLTRLIEALDSLVA